MLSCWIFQHFPCQKWNDVAAPVPCLSHFLRSEFKHHKTSRSDAEKDRACIHHQTIIGRSTVTQKQPCPHTSDPSTAETTMSSSPVATLPRSSSRNQSRAGVSGHNFSSFTAADRHRSGTSLLILQERTDDHKLFLHCKVTHATNTHFYQ